MRLNNHRINDHKYGSSIRQQKKAAIKAANKERHRKECARPKGRMSHVAATIQWMYGPTTVSIDAALLAHVYGAMPLAYLRNMS